MEDFTLEKNPVKISLIFWCRIKNTKTHSDPYKMHALKSGLNFKNVYICFFFSSLHEFISEMYIFFHCKFSLFPYFVFSQRHAQQ